MADIMNTSRRKITGLLGLLLLGLILIGYLNFNQINKGDHTQQSVATLPIQAYYQGDYSKALDYLKSQPSSFRKDPMTQHVVAQLTALNGGRRGIKKAEGILVSLKSTDQEIGTQNLDKSVDLWLEILSILEQKGSSTQGNSATQDDSAQTNIDPQAIYAKSIEFANMAYIAQDFPVSMRALEGALALKADDIEAQNLYARSLVATQKNHNEALAAEIYKSLSKRGLVSADANLEALQIRIFNKEFAEAYAAARDDYIAKDYPAAKQKLEHLLEGQAGNISTRQLYAQTLVGLGDNESLTQALSILTALEKEGVEAASTWISLIATKMQTDSVQKLYQQALDSYSEKNYPQSLTYLDQIITKIPDYSPALHLQAQIFASGTDVERLEIATKFFRSEDKVLSRAQKAWMAVILRQKIKILSTSEIISSLGDDVSIFELKELSEFILINGANGAEISEGLRIFIRRALVEGINSDAAFQDILDLDISLGCRHYKTALRAEIRKIETLGIAFPSIPKCKKNDVENEYQDQDTSALFSQLYAAVKTLRDNDLDMAMFDNESITSFERQYEIVPPGYRKPFSIVSDADSQTTDDTLKHMEVLQDKLGLPVSTSLFIDALTGPQTTNINIDKLPTSIFFPQMQKTGLFGSNSAAANTFRHWYQGVYDHYHGWSSTRLAASHRFEKPLKIKAVNDLNITPIFENLEIETGVSSHWDISNDFLESWLSNRFAVLRLFFSSPPSRATIYELNLGDYGLTYDVNAHGYFSNQIQDYGQSMWMVELPIAKNNDVSFSHINDFTSKKGNTISLNIKTLDCDTDTNNANRCDIDLIKIEADIHGRMAHEMSAEWLNEFGVRGALYTAHGGDRMSSFSPQSYISQEWGTERPAGTTFLGFDQPLAGLQGRKAYIGDLVELIGVRGIRSFASNLPNKNVMARFPLSPITGREFNNTASLQTNWATTPNFDKNETFAANLNLRPEIEATLKAFETCSFASASWLPGYVETSLKSLETDYLAGEIWYSHFADKCKRKGGKRSNLGFDDTTIAAFETLSRHSHGIMPNDEAAQYPNRLWVLPPSSAFRSRILEEEVNNYGIDLDISGATVNIESRDSQFYKNELFPRPSLASRDLNGLTLEVPIDTLQNAAVTVDNISIGALIKTITDDKAYVTVLDTTDAISISSALNAKKALDLKAKQCIRPDIPLNLTNISSLGFSLNGSSLAQSKGNIAIEILLKGKAGSVVFSNNSDTFADQFQKNKNTIYAFSRQAGTKIDGHMRYLVPTYKIDNLRGWNTEDIPTMTYGFIDKVCIYSQGISAAKLSDIRAYRYVTSNTLPNDPLIIGGKVKLNKGVDHKDLFARLTTQNGERQYVAVNADGFYYGRLNSTANTPKFDQAVKDEWIKVELMQSNSSNDISETVSVQNLHLLNSKLDIDLELSK